MTATTDIAALRAAAAAPVEWTESDEYAQCYSANMHGYHCHVEPDEDTWTADVHMDGVGWWEHEGPLHDRAEAQAWCERVARSLAAPWLAQHDADTATIAALKEELAAGHQLLAQATGWPEALWSLLDAQPASDGRAQLLQRAEAAELRMRELEAQRPAFLLRVAEEETTIRILDADGNDPTGSLHEFASDAMEVCEDATGSTPYTPSDGDVWTDVQEGDGVEAAMGELVCSLLRSGFAVRVEREGGPSRG